MRKQGVSAPDARMYVNGLMAFGIESTGARVEQTPKDSEPAMRARPHAAPGLAGTTVNLGREIRQATRIR